MGVISNVWVQFLLCNLNKFNQLKETKTDFYLFIYF